MKDLGFQDIVNPLMVNTISRIMTIKNGAKMKGIDLETIKDKFKEFGFQLEDINE